MRQFISEKMPDNKGLLIIYGKDYKHLKEVLRVKIGDMIQARLPDSSLQNTTVSKIDENEKIIYLQICGENENAKNLTRGTNAHSIQKESDNLEKIEYYLFQFIPKPSKMEQIIRQATECGVKCIIPVIGEYSQKSAVQSLLKKGSENERISRIIKESREQSGSPIDTKFLSPMTIENALDFWKIETCENERIAFSLWERNENHESMKKAVQEKKGRIKKAALAIGSEGGISQNEIEILSKAGFKTIHFKGNILRCETASLYGIASLQSTIRNENE